MFLFVFFFILQPVGAVGTSFCEVIVGVTFDQLPNGRSFSY